MYTHLQQYTVNIIVFIGLTYLISIWYKKQFRNYVYTLICAIIMLSINILFKVDKIFLSMKKKYFLLLCKSSVFCFFDNSRNYYYIHSIEL